MHLTYIMLWGRVNELPAALQGPLLYRIGWSRGGRAPSLKQKQISGSSPGLETLRTGNVRLRYQLSCEIIKKTLGLK